MSEIERRLKRGYDFGAHGNAGDKEMYIVQRLITRSDRLEERVSMLGS